MQEPLNVSVENSVATITLYRPSRGNAITPVMFGLLLESLESLKSRTDVRVVVLTGSGKYFCTGMDLGSANQKAMQGKARTGATDVAAVFEGMRNYPKPIVARINGPAMGGGWGVLFSTDIRFLSISSDLTKKDCCPVELVSIL